MTLEDFFTLTEMKGGLTAPARVEELVAVMEKEKDSFIKNVGDATRQWSTVASVIAATDDRDCLDLFLRLDGLWFINRWLKDTQTFDADSGDCFVEESILSLLQALGKLKINNERLTSSGISITVRNLLNHKNTSIQDKARALLDDWKHSKVGNSVKSNSEQCEADNHEADEPGNRLAKENGNTLCSSSDTTPSKVNNEQSELPAAGGNVASSGCCSGQQSGAVDGKLIVSDKPAIDDMDCGKEVAEDAPGSLVKLDTDKGQFSSTEVCPTGPWRKPESSSLKDQTSSEPKRGNNDSKSNCMKLECSVNDSKQKSQSGSVSDKLSEMEIAAAVISKSGDIFSGTVKEDTSEPLARAVMATNSNDINPSTVKSACGNVDMAKADSCTRVDDTGVLKNCSMTEELKALGQGGIECSNNPLQDSPKNGVKTGNSEDPETTPPQMKNVGSVGRVMDRFKDDTKHFSSSGLFVTPRSSKVINESSKTSAMDLECGAVDALEVARLVAKEVESQMEDYDEHFGSSSSKVHSRGVTRLLDSPEYLHDRKNQNTSDDAPSNESPTVENMSSEGSQKKEEEEKEEYSTNSDTMEGEPENVVQDMESSQVTEAAQEPETNVEKETCAIDLNQDVFSEEADDVTNCVSNPVAVVSASRTLAAPGLPSSPLKFEGTHGWKGSVATSAFRTILVGGTTSGPTLRQDFIIDLNVAEDGDEKAANPVSGKQNPIPSGLPSGESSVELSPKRSAKLKFDLNQMSEEFGDLPSSPDWKVGGHPLGPQVVHWSTSPASSSSSLRKPALRNFDLNDRPSNYHDPLSDQHQLFFGQSSSSSSHNKLNAYGGYGGSLNDPVISIMGTKVKKSTTILHQTPAPFPNGRISEVDPNANLARTGAVLGGAGGSAIPYLPSHVLNYSGLAMGPAMPYSSPMYGTGVGSVAYMVDPRGLSFVPPLISQPPSSTLPDSFASNMMVGPPSGPNGTSPRPSLDLNSAFRVEGSNRDPSGYRQLFIPGQGRMVGEQFRDGFQPPLFTGVGGRRKEPDGGWGEPFVANYKHHQPPRL